MKRSETIRRVGPSVVAFGSRMVSTSSLSPPPFPPIVGTGFVVDSRGLVVTNRHVIEAMEKIPSAARFVMVFPGPHVSDEKVFVGILTRRILRVFILDALEAPKPLYGKLNPDFAFAEIDVQGLPALDISDKPNVIEVGTDIVTMGSHNVVFPSQFARLIIEYQEHPEAKSLAPDGTPCQPSTSGLLQRAHVVAGEIRYVGKETDRKWEEGDDISLLEFAATEYGRSTRVIATEEIKTKILELA